MAPRTPKTPKRTPKTPRKSSGKGKIVTRSRSQGAFSPPPGQRRVVRPVSTRLMVPCCLRCLKRAHEFGEMGDCGARNPTLRKCSYCRRLGKPCRRIPPRYNKVANKIFIQLEHVLAVETAEDDGLDKPARKQLELDCDALSVDIEAFIRKEGKKGLGHTPKGEEINLLILEQFQLFNKQMEKLLAVKRHEAELDPEDDSEVDFLSDIETGALGLYNWPLEDVTDAQASDDEPAAPPAPTDSDPDA